MKRFFYAAPVVMAILCLGMLQAAPPMNDDLPGVYSAGELVRVPSQPSRTKASKDRVSHHDGHQFVSRNKLKSLRNGRHHIHTTNSGHQWHAVVQNGKIKNMEVTHNGKKLPVQRVNRNRRTMAEASYVDASSLIRSTHAFPGSDGVGSDLIPTAQPSYGGGYGDVGWCCRCYQPSLRIVVVIYIWWPANSCCAPDDGGDGGYDPYSTDRY
jgi:hypothetical protein